MYGFFEDSIILIYRPVCLKKRKHIAWVINKKRSFEVIEYKIIYWKKFDQTWNLYTSNHISSVLILNYACDSYLW